MVVGYSMGGLPATILSLSYPQKVSRLVVIDGVATTPDKNILRVTFGIVTELISIAFIKSGFNLVVSICLEFLINLIFHPLVLIQHVFYLYKTKPVLKKLSKETLILWGRKDEVLSIDYGIRLHKMIKTSQLEIVDNGHFWALINPKRAVSKINNFVVN